MLVVFILQSRGDAKTTAVPEWAFGCHQRFMIVLGKAGSLAQSDGDPFVIDLSSPLHQNFIRVNALWARTRT